MNAITKDKGNHCTVVMKKLGDICELGYILELRLPTSFSVRSRYEQDKICGSNRLKYSYKREGYGKEGCQNILRDGAHANAIETRNQSNGILHSILKSVDM